MHFLSILQSMLSLAAYTALQKSMLHRLNHVVLMTSNIVPKQQSCV